ncbi:CgeB family protein [Salinimicrobium sediminilitoris]|uniref:CgeB family protein n=1 Tax=Salinimicrobium sediminilitoris TaxID=2876715 RepID=UPI001E58D332|nr:glycosyltransferase [Salinimicrobium sediminilitoris]MCC8359609.1 glycosyltransferase [Salinimicrobium sediminilitoris]
MKRNLKIAFFGSSIVSAYWNGAATYYRGIVKALHKMGHEVTFYEPDIYERQKHRDIEDPEWCTVKVYPKDKVTLQGLLREASEADVIIKASGVGAFDDFLEDAVVQLKKEDNLIIFWDVDAPATLDRIESDPLDPFNSLIPKYDLVLTYGGGQPVIDAYERNGAKRCVPIYNALDTDTHFPVDPNPKFEGTLAFLGNRLPDREKRVEEFFIRPAKRLSDDKFLLGGSGWGDKKMPKNIDYVGHVYTKDHNAFNCTPKAVLNISRDSMAKYGFSPATRVFEAAGAGACIITDYWKGIDTFFVPGKEILVANSGEEVEMILTGLTSERAKEIGKAAYEKVLAKHTYNHRAELLESVISEKIQPVEQKQ